MMFRKKECVAMLLAGGQGSRLYALTKKTAKPAVRFGGKYRIIDFTLSNCVNSGIDTVGVLTQYQPLVLNEYIGNGLPWGLDAGFGAVMVLPACQGQIPAEWAKGSATGTMRSTCGFSPATTSTGWITTGCCASTSKREPTAPLP